MKTPGKSKGKWTATVAMIQTSLAKRLLNGFGWYMCSGTILQRWDLARPIFRARGRILILTRLNFCQAMVCRCTPAVPFSIIKLISLSDPNVPQNLNSLDTNWVSCYGFSDRSAFPFHWCCFEILVRVLTGSTEIGQIDKDLLYHVMLGLSPQYSRYLEIDYGNLTGVEQFWDCVPGEEYSVTHPATPGFEEILRKLVEEKAFKGTSTSSLSLAHKVKRDPFGELPFDLLYSILRFLPGDSTRALMSASWPVYGATRHPALWKQLMYWGMPWFWELHKLVGEDNVTDLDYKNLYLWLNKATMPVYGMRGPFLGIANRRRIWCACAQLADKYFLSFHQRESTTDEDFNSVLQQNQIVQLPMVKYPQSDMEVRTISKQWLHTLEEFNGRSALLETFWSSDDYLMGLTVSFRTSRRPFGRDAATGGAHQHVLSIESSDWISGLVLYMPVMDLLDAHACTAVKGIEVNFVSGKHVSIGSCAGNHRPFMVSEDHYLVGLVGQAGEDGIISRFGILESPATESDVLQTLFPIILHI
ncbi:F-box domain-containing protein [Histoplasma capsulatum var. duboisii H88]|uniref:F-box domain-containing protein n=1 Tax=Ajellomyces capsulatus (strain H88) TaxID=544711 RepID=A0A8A1LJ79_AJEC8|nr:F-box domain-containing protein [Histoplasma capsulatum var. duboisii H88]